MNLRPDPAEAARLDALAQQATGYALHMMLTTGSVPPTVIADTEEGFVFCMPAGLPDEAAKDRFADVARLLAVAHNARAIVMVAEAWVRMITMTNKSVRDSIQEGTPCRQRFGRSQVPPSHRVATFPGGQDRNCESQSSSTGDLIPP